MKILRPAHIQVYLESPHKLGDAICELSNSKNPSPGPVVTVKIGAEIMGEKSGASTGIQYYLGLSKHLDHQ